MPKQNKEINKFNYGIVSTPSSSDTTAEAASYSRNVESQASSGRLQGIERDKILTDNGFEINMSSTQGENISWIDTITFRMYSVLDGNYHKEWFKDWGTSYAQTTTDLSADLTSFSTTDGWEGHHAIIDEMHNAEGDVTTRLVDARFFILKSYSANWPSDAIELSHAAQMQHRQYAFYFHNNEGEQCYVPGLRLTSTPNKYEVFPGGFTSGSYQWMPGDGHNNFRGTVTDAGDYGHIFSANSMIGIGTKHFIEINKKVKGCAALDTSTSTAYNNEDFGLSLILRDFDNAGNIIGNAQWFDETTHINTMSMDCSVDRTKSDATKTSYILLSALKDIIEDSFFYEGDSSLFTSVTLTAVDVNNTELTIQCKPGMVDSFSYFTHFNNGLNLIGQKAYARITTYPFTHGQLNNRVSLSEFNDNTAYSFGTNHIPTLGMNIIGDVDTEINANYPLKSNINLQDFIISPQEDDNTKLDIIGVEDTPLSTKNIVRIPDIYSKEVSNKETIGDLLVDDINNIVLTSDDDKIHLGTGEKTSRTKVYSTTKKNPLRSSDINSRPGIFDAGLKNFINATADDPYKEYILHEIHGSKPTKDASHSHYISKDPSDSSVKIRLDWDAELDSTPGVTLYAALQSGSAKTIAGLKVGQVFITTSTTDFTDGAMVAWKKYNYDVTESAVTIGELYMFCGYIEGTEDVPILKYIGKHDSNGFGGQSAFVYATKNNSSEIFQISLTSTGNYNSDTAFTGGSAGNVKDKNGSNYSILNTGSRVTSVNLSDFAQFANQNYITSITKCSSPLLFNNIGLLGGGTVYGSSSEIFYNNGDLKIYYRHGVFWVGADNSAQALFRINAIDFHGLTESGVQLEEISLNFSRIPAQLWAQNGDGIIRRTIQDELYDDEFDPKNHTWNRVPQSSEIVGLCETFESSIKAKNEVGEHYRYRGGHTGHDDSITVNRGTSRMNQGSSLDDSANWSYSGKGWADEAGQSYSSDDCTTWNSKLWILYRKKSDDSFRRWDLFLYCINTIQIDDAVSGYYMADRTPPYQEAKYVKLSAGGSEKFYYPGDSAFPIEAPLGQGTDTEDDNGMHKFGLDAAPEDVIGPLTAKGDTVKGNVSKCGGKWSVHHAIGESQHTSGEIGSAFGVYSSHGRWKVVNSPYHFGFNTGWDCDNPRDSRPVPGSLKPLVPYSTAIFADKNPFYRQDDTNDDLCHFPRHAVTFLNDMSGDFIATSSNISRDPFTTAYNQNADFRRIKCIFSSTTTADIFHSNDNDFFRPIVEEDRRIYNRDIALMTVDDKSGAGTLHHPSIQTGLQPVASGGAKPGFIDWPSAGDLHCSTNGGFPGSDTLGDSSNIGWDGYSDVNTGYYVYINRKWKTAHHATWHPSNDDEQTIGELYSSDFNNEIEGLNSQFQINSCLSIFDNYDMPGDFSPSGWDWDNANTPKYRKGVSSHGVYNDLYDGVFNNNFNLSSEDEDSSNKFNRYHGAALCTMNKIKMAISEFNNIFPTILVSNFDYDGSDAGYKRFISGYICGVKHSTAGEGASVAFIRTNLDSLWRSQIFYTEVPGVTDTNLQVHKNGNMAGLSLHIPVARVRDTSIVMENGPNDQILENRALRIARIDIMTTIGLNDETSRLYRTQGNQHEMRLRQAGLSTGENAELSTDLTVFSLSGLTPAFGGYPVSETHAETYDIFASCPSSDGGYIYFGTEDNYGSLIHPDDDSVYIAEEGGMVFDAGNDDISLFTSSTDSTLIMRDLGAITFTTPTASAGGNIQAGTHYYKMSIEYDDEYESPLTSGTPFFKELSSDYEYMDINIQLSQGVINSMNRRATGIIVYKSEVEDGPYRLVNPNAIIKFDDGLWVKSGAKFTYRFRDYGATAGSASYQSLTGMPEYIEDSSMGYGLSVVHHGYMFISKAVHADLGNVRRYIFRSQPFNFFAFNYSEDYVILPEEPIALASFDSRIYAWGTNHIYRINPTAMVIEDTYEGVTIDNKYAYVKTEFGLFFFDKNNIYLHNGSRPSPIGDAILYASDTKSKYLNSSFATQGYVKIEQGYRELLQETRKHNMNARIKYLGNKNSIIIFLVDSDKQGVALVYNLLSKRWDIWDSPMPQSLFGGKETSVIINDSDYIYDFTSTVSAEYSKNYRKSFDWMSNNINFGSGAATKIFKTVSFGGIPVVYNAESLSNSAILSGDQTINVFNSSNPQSNTIQAYIDGSPVNLTVHNRNYSEIDMGETSLVERSTVIYSHPNFSKIEIITNFRNPDLSTDGVNPNITYTDELVQSFITKGMYIKIRDEIMLVTKVVLKTDFVDGSETASCYTRLHVERAQMGTTKPEAGGVYQTGDIVKVISPIFKFPSGSKGKYVSIRLLRQTGFIDSLNITYRSKPIK
tara:strand:+ start:43 stop:7125 length:7083 start_codon:yes stop_codon:yes gene_type:complete